MVDKAAVALAKKRWAGMTAEERSANSSKLGKARSKKLSKKRRSQIAAAAAAERWRRYREKQADSAGK